MARRATLLDVLIATPVIIVEEGLKLLTTQSASSEKAENQIANVWIVYS
jgi:hypothetical protein